MAKITRKAQQIFASTAGGSGVAEPGSTADGATIFTTNLDVIQSPAFLEGLAAMIIAGSKRLPVYEEINAVYYTVTRQLAYLFQDGLPDWNVDTTYYHYSIVRKTGTYQLYGSIIDDNTGNALPSAVTDSNWQYLGDLSTISNSSYFYAGGTTTGSANAQVLASVSPSGFSLSNNGSTVACTAGFTNTGSTTFNIAGTGATIVKQDTGSGLVALPANAIIAGTTIFLTVNTAGSCLVLTDAPALGTTAPTNLDTTNFQNAAGNLAFGTAPVLPSASTATTQATTDSSTKVSTTAFANPGQSIGTNGYHKFPGGLIMQWGTYAMIANTSAVAFPLTFPTACLNVSVTHGTSTAQNISASALTTTQFTLDRGATTNETVYWQAIGN